MSEMISAGPTQEELMESINHRLVRDLLAGNEQANPAMVTTYPLNGGEQAYRGWYHRQGTGRSRWCPGQSRHGGPRPGAPHVGADLWSGQATAIVAVRSGRIEYNPRNDPTGWGNHIYLYFRQQGTVYIAVYAHLDASSGFPGDKPVAAGDPIGYPGCSGNAGENGTCPRTYRCNDRIAIADHLHFEVMDATTAVRSDPVAFFGWMVRHAADNTCADCASTEQLR